MTTTMEMTKLIGHPELLDRTTLYELRSTLARHPYYQTARLLMLQNLYLLHDASFNEELRRAALYVTDRKTIFQMIEAVHYQLRQQNSSSPRSVRSGEFPIRPSRTVALIDSFLGSIPQEDEPEDTRHSKRRPTPADATIDYVAYLLETESDTAAATAPQMKGQGLIDSFLEQEQGRILLNDLPQEPAVEEPEEHDESDEEYFTETLARIYIRQGRYRKALDIISRLSEKFPNKNVYFADQIRFLQKLIINSQKQKN